MARKKSTKSKSRQKQKQSQRQNVIQSVVVRLSDEGKRKRPRRRRAVKREREPEQPVIQSSSLAPVVYQQVLPYTPTTPFESSPAFKEEIKRSILEEMGVLKFPQPLTTAEKEQIKESRKNIKKSTQEPPSETTSALNSGVITIPITPNTPASKATPRPRSDVPLIANESFYQSPPSLSTPLLPFEDQFRPLSITRPTTSNRENALIVYRPQMETPSESFQSPNNQVITIPIQPPPTRQTPTPKPQNATPSELVVYQPPSSRSALPLPFEEPVSQPPFGQTPLVPRNALVVYRPQMETPSEPFQSLSNTGVITVNQPPSSKKSRAPKRERLTPSESEVSQPPASRPTPTLPFEETFQPPETPIPFNEPPNRNVLGQMPDELKFPRPLTKAEKERIKQVRKTTKILPAETEGEPTQVLTVSSQEVKRKKPRLIQKPRLPPAEVSIGLEPGVPENYRSAFTEQNITEGAIPVPAFIPTPIPQLFGSPAFITPIAQESTAIMAFPEMQSAPRTALKGDIELPASRIPGRPRWDSMQNLTNAYERLTGQRSPGVNKENLLRILFVELTEEDPSTKTKKEIQTTVRKKLRERGV